MAARNPFHRDIDEKVDDISSNRTNGQGELDLDEMINDLAAWFTGNPKILQHEARRIATAIVRQWDEGRRPRPSMKRAGVAQAGLFRPEYLIPYAPNKRVWMERASREQFAAWMSIRATEHAVQMAAHAHVAQYQAERFNAWTAHDLELVDVERRYFGYVDPVDDDVPDDADDE